MKIHVADPQNVHTNWVHPMPAGWQSYYEKWEADKAIERLKLKVQALEAEKQRLDGIVSEVHGWIVCAAITTAEDMAGNFHRIAEITTPKDEEL